MHLFLRHLFSISILSASMLSQIVCPTFSFANNGNIITLMEKSALIIVESDANQLLRKFWLCICEKPKVKWFSPILCCCWLPWCGLTPARMTALTRVKLVRRHMTRIRTLIMMNFRRVIIHWTHRMHVLRVTLFTNRVSKHRWIRHDAERIGIKSMLPASVSMFIFRFFFHFFFFDFPCPDWTALITLGYAKPIKGYPMVTKLSMADSPLNELSTGNIYFGLRKTEPVYYDLRRKNKLTAFFSDESDRSTMPIPDVSTNYVYLIGYVAQVRTEHIAIYSCIHGRDDFAGGCEAMKWKSMAWPGSMSKQISRVFPLLVFSLQQLQTNTSEYTAATMALTSRHPSAQMLLHKRNTILCKIEILELVVSHNGTGRTTISKDEFYNVDVDFWWIRETTDVGVSCRMANCVVIPTSASLIIIVFVLSISFRVDLNLWRCKNKSAHKTNNGNLAGHGNAFHYSKRFRVSFYDSLRREVHSSRQNGTEWSRQVADKAMNKNQKINNKQQQQYTIL